MLVVKANHPCVARAKTSRGNFHSCLRTRSIDDHNQVAALLRGVTMSRYDFGAMENFAAAVACCRTQSGRKPPKRMNEAKYHGNPMMALFRSMPR